MYNKKFVQNIVSLIIENIEAINKRGEGIHSPGDFVSSEAGMILLDSICMKLIAIGESLKNLDKITNNELLTNYPQINWKQAMGMRDIIAHHYFDVDADEIFKTIKEDVPLLQSILGKMKANL